MIFDIIELWLNNHKWAIYPLGFFFGMAPFLAAWCQIKVNELDGRESSEWLKFLGKW